MILYYITMLARYERGSVALRGTGPVRSASLDKRRVGGLWLGTANQWPIPMFGQMMYCDFQDTLHQQDSTRYVVRSAVQHMDNALVAMPKMSKPPRSCLNLQTVLEATPDEFSWRPRVRCKPWLWESIRSCARIIEAYTGRHLRKQKKMRTESSILLYYIPRFCVVLGCTSWKWIVMWVVILQCQWAFYSMPNAGGVHVQMLSSFGFDLADGTLSSEFKLLLHVWQSCSYRFNRVIRFYSNSHTEELFFLQSPWIGCFTLW